MAITTLPTFTKEDEKKVAPLFQSILGGTAAAAPEATNAPFFQDDVNAYKKRQEALGRKSVSTKQAKKAPLDRTKSDEEKAFDVGVESADYAAKKHEQSIPPSESINRFADIMSKVKSQGLKGEAKGTLFDRLLPDPDTAALAAAQGSMAYDSFGDTAFNQVQDEAIQNIALNDYMKKASNPYRGVDLESIDRLIASTFGGKVQGMKNVAEPTVEFNNLVGSVNNLQAGKINRAKETLDYMKNVLKPVQTGAYGVSTQPLQPRSSGNGSQQRMVDKDIINAYGKIDEKNAPILQKFQQVKENLVAGDLASVGSSLPILAKTVGADVGNIAVQEADRYMPSSLKMSFTKLLSYLESNPGAKVPPETTKAIAAYVSRAENSFKKRVDGEKERVRAGFDASPIYRDPNKRIYEGVNPYFDKYAPKQQEKNIKNPRLKELLNKGIGTK